MKLKRPLSLVTGLLALTAVMSAGPHEVNRQINHCPLLRAQAVHDSTAADQQLMNRQEMTATHTEARGEVIYTASPRARPYYINRHSRVSSDR